MAVEKSYARLGLFLVVALLVVMATALLFIQRLRSQAVLELVTFTTENVSGLDVSSPVRYRGVPVGRVAQLRIDPSSLRVEIGFELFRERLTGFGFDVEQLQAMALPEMAPNLRAQLVSNPVTGESYLLLDRVENPPPPLPLEFTPDRPYVPSIPSAFAVVQDRLPAILDRAEATMETIREIVARVPDSLDRSNRFFTNVERIFRDSELPALSADARTFFAKSNEQIAQLTSNVDRLIGTGGTLVTAVDDARAAIKDSELPETTKAVREALDTTSLAAEDLRRSLPAIRDSLEQLRELARMLEEQPESVVYGPRPSGANAR
jgi:ABC-type transporter Mla subunit MlaD